MNNNVDIQYMARNIGLSVMSQLKKMNPVQMVIIALLLLFIFVDTPIPQDILLFIGTPIGIFVLMALVFMTFLTSGPLVGVIMILVAYELYRRSGEGFNKNTMIDKMLNAPSKSYDNNASLSAMNQFPITLEEEVIHNMIPLVKGDMGPKTYKPTMSDFDGTTEL